MAGFTRLRTSASARGVREPRVGESVVFRQSTLKLFRILPLASLMAGASGLLVVVGLHGAGIHALLAGGLGLVFFGPALFILLWAFVQPNYLVVDASGLRFRLYSLEATVPWEEVRTVSAGAGWPSLTFYDGDQVSQRFQFRGLLPLGWLLEIPTRIVSLILRRPLANMYPTTRRQLVDGFRANEQMFGFHYGLPTSLLDSSTREIVATMRGAVAAAGSRKADSLMPPIEQTPTRWS